MINEIAQWATLAFMAVFLFGLTRQLGAFLVSKQENVVADTGPAVGQPVPEPLLTSDERAILAGLAADHPANSAAIFITDEDCAACGDVMAPLKGARRAVPLAIVARSASPAYRRVLEQIADLVIVDSAREQRLEHSSLNVTPFLLFADSKLRVLKKDMSADLAMALERFADSRIARKRNGQPATSDDALLVHHSSTGS